jgi:hypothetical protein
MIVNKAILKIARAIVTELKEMRVLSPPNRTAEAYDFETS